MALKIIDDAIQAFGGAGVADEAVWPRLNSVSARCASRTALMKSHRAIARLELRKYANGATSIASGRVGARHKAGRGYVGVKPVEECHRLMCRGGLDRWMRRNIEGYLGQLTVLQFKGGQSNPTYRLDTPGASYVMRRKPFGKLLPSHNAVDREFKVIEALHKQGFPVARPYRLASTKKLSGRPSTSCRWKQGECSGIRPLPSQPPRERSLIFTNKIITLARLHSYDPEKIRSWRLR